jgi:hypothetical protein
MTYIKAACNTIAQKVDAREAPPRKESDDGNGDWLRPKEVGLFAGAPESDTVSGHHFQGKLELIDELAYIKQLEQPAAKKAPTGNCDHGHRESKCKDCGTGYCTHGRRKDSCKDCGTGYCTHGRQKGKCKDCGTGYCQHGRQKSKCKDCGTGHCTHGRRKSQCKDCGTGYCTHGRRKDRCKDCGGTGYCTHGRRKDQCKDCRSKATGNRQQAIGNRQ